MGSPPVVVADGRQAEHPPHIDILTVKRFTFCCVCSVKLGVRPCNFHNWGRPFTTLHSVCFTICKAQKNTQ